VSDRGIDPLQEAPEDAALDRAAGHDPRRRVDREELRARPRAGPASRIPAQTSAPAAISDPFVAKQLSTAPAGLLPATPRSGCARMFAIHWSMTRSARGVWSD